jgi:deoxyribodipyrimidine photolyase-related protein
MERIVYIILPNQLFKKHPCLDRKADIFLVEEPRYFSDFKFHKQKLIFHRASMRMYKEYLEEKGFIVHYYPWNKKWVDDTNKYEKIYMVKPFDHILETKLPPNIIFEESPAFLGGALKKSKKYLMARFYQQQRKRLNILMDGESPVGGQWSFDSFNRKPLKKGLIPPSHLNFSENKYVEEAIIYVQKHFPDNPGSVEQFIYPINHADADACLDNFIKDKLVFFGDYQDALSTDYPYLYHSLLSPLLNSGLLTPKEVLTKVLKANVPINSLEGFIRQLIGWREFILQIYLLEGDKQRSSNFFNHTKKVPQNFYHGNTGIEPIDHVVKKILDSAYAHHIERLMVLGNYMLLSEYDPDEIYSWFMEMFIDSYDWVMVPNIYGMSQYADGGLMSTKPYISGSNYILKMSNYSKGSWCKVWDELFWSFIEKHEKTLAKNPRMFLLLKQLQKKRMHKP